MAMQESGAKRCFNNHNFAIFKMRKSENYGLGSEAMKNSSWASKLVTKMENGVQL